MAGRNNLKDKLEDGELDLSMMQLVDVPVKVRSVRFDFLTYHTETVSPNSMLILLLHRR